MSEVLTLIAALAALATLIAVLLLLRKSGDAPSTDLAVASHATRTDLPSGAEVPQVVDAFALAIEPAESASGVEEAFEISAPDDGNRLALLELMAEPPARADTSNRPPWLSGATLEAFGRLPETAGHLRSARGMRVTFSPQAMRNLRAGQWSPLTRADGSTMSTLVDASGKVREHGTLIRGIGSAATGALLLTTVCASVAVYAQQQWIEQTLRSIESKLSGVLERLQDTDHGRVEGAWAVADQIDGL